MFEPKIPAIGAITGFVLSLLTGILSGAGFPVVLLRAVGIAALFGALAFLAAYLLKAFLPELFMPGQDTGESLSPDRGAEFGSVVNLTVGDSDAMPFEARTDSDSSGTLPDFLQSPGEETYGAETPELIDMGTKNPGSAIQGGPVSQPGAPLPVGRMNPEERPMKPGKGIGGLDSLPDLQDFIPDVAPEAVEEGDSAPEPGSGSGTSKRESAFTASDLTGAGIESETMARAIRTILSKDS